MRIALITREYPPETPWGGIAAFYRQLAQALIAHGHDVEVFAQGIYRDHTEVVDGVTVHRVIARQNVTGQPTAGDMAGTHDLGDFAYALADKFLHVFLARHREKPFEIVEGHEHLGVNALINLYAPQDVITVTRYHTSYHSLVKRKLVDWPVSPRVTALEQLSLEQAHYRISTSQYIDLITREDFGLAEAAPILANFAARPPEPPNPAPSREKLLAFAGRLVLEHKRPDLAARAFVRLAQEFPDWRIEFAGPDMELPDGRTTWQVCAGHLSACAPERYQHHGVLDAAGMDRLYRRARLLVVPSRFESFGMVAIEAMHRGCVPIVADQTALTDATHDPELEFRNGSLDDLVERLRRLMADDACWQVKSTACLQRVQVQFNSEHLVRQNLYYFESIRQEKRHAQPAHRSSGPTLPPFISIVTPSFNQGRYIEETIVSVLYQDYPRFEHVVMDAGSKDETVAILSKYPHLRWQSEPDKGQAHAINKGLLATTGEIVAYLNSDDVYRAGTFHTVAKVFQENPGVQIVVGNCDVIDENSVIKSHYRAKACGLTDLLQYWGWDRLHCLPQQSIFFRRTLLAELGLFDPRFHMVMDYQFWLRVLAAGHRFHVIDRTLAAFRIVHSTKTGGRTDEMYLEEYAASAEFWPRLPAGLRRHIAWGARQQVGRKMLDMAEHFLLNSGQGRRPLRFLGIACRYNPLQAFTGRFLYTLAGALCKGPNRLYPKITAAHRRHLDRLWRKSQRKT